MSQSQQPAQPCTLRVMTFNVRGARFEDAANAWPNRAALNVATIREQRPDLIGFQEVQPGNLLAYLDQLGDYALLPGPAVSDPNPNGHEYNTIAWRRQRFEPLETGAFYLSRTPDRWSGDWDTSNVRAANWVKLRCADTGHAVLHLNTHLDHRSELARHEGSKLILRKLDEINRDGLPAIITGDFNCPATRCAAYEHFMQAGFADAYIAAGQPDGIDVNTYHGFGGWNIPEIGGRIDWILAKAGDHSIAVEGCTIIRDAAPPLYPSDHYPVLAILRI